MESVLDEQSVLSLNASWQPIGWRTVKQAMIALNGGASGIPPALALDILLDDKGDLVYANPLNWEEWYRLDVRPGDKAVLTKNKAVRAPVAIISRNFNKTLLKAPRLTKKAIRERDGGRCMYTGDVVGKDGNVDHVVPRDKGGKDEWGNLVWCRKDINFKKGNRLNHEVGLNLISQPKAPKAVPIAVTLGSGKRPEHRPFLIR